MADDDELVVRLENNAVGLVVFRYRGDPVDATGAECAIE